MLFNKKKKADEIEEVTEQHEENPAQNVASVPQVAQVSSAVFSSRIAAVFDRMYSSILSADLNNNVYQVESGKAEVAGHAIALRGYYDALYASIEPYIQQEDLERFQQTFSRGALIEILKSGKTSVFGTYCFLQEPAEAVEVASEDEGNIDEEQSFTYLELRADAIPDPTGTRQRCILYIRLAKTYQDVVTAGGQQLFNKEYDWKDASLNQLLGGAETVLFEYDIAQDCMHLHEKTDAEGTERQIKNYMRSMDLRRDWTLFHDDTDKMKDVIVRAAKGEKVETTIRYRVHGEKNQPFHVHKILCAPCQDSGNPMWLVGALTDIEEEIAKSNQQHDLNNQINKLVNGSYEELSEVDIKKDLIYHLASDENGFHRDGAPNSFSGYIRIRVTNGVIMPNSVENYRQLLDAKFLEKKTSTGRYEFECELTMPGKTESRWYTETFYRMAADGHYLRCRKDTTSNYERRNASYQKDELSRFAEYNRQMITVLTGLVEFRSVESGAHIDHVCSLTKILLEDVRNRSPLYDLDQKKIDLYCEAAMMHDIGKITIPDNILNKPGKLTPEEFEIMKTHTTAGAKIIEKMHLPGQEELLSYCYEAALYHHERFDGHGYPQGIAGDDIPIGVQAIGVADVYDAMVSTRCYKQAISIDEVLKDILNGECGAFNPRLMESLRACADKFRAEYELQSDAE